jgi:hypothetical protein
MESQVEKLAWSRSTIEFIRSVIGNEEAMTWRRTAELIHSSYLDQHKPESFRYAVSNLLLAKLLEKKWISFSGPGNSLVFHELNALRDHLASSSSSTTNKEQKEMNLTWMRDLFFCFMLPHMKEPFDRSKGVSRIANSYSGWSSRSSKAERESQVNQALDWWISTKQLIRLDQPAGYLKLVFPKI